jgi:TetR/AcrR family transcriptional repressor of nem operon
MGHSKEDKTRSHERIVEVASARMRESGTSAPGVAEIMREAGLTHGGFYKHFDSRDDLVAEAVTRAFAENEAFMQTQSDLPGFVAWYLSEQHRDEPATGCGVAALGGDASRGEARVRAAFGEQVSRYLEHLGALLGDDAREPPSVVLSALVGALVVARAVDDEELSAQILSDARAAVTSWGS